MGVLTAAMGIAGCASSPQSGGEKPTPPPVQPEAAAPAPEASAPAVVEAPPPPAPVVLPAGANPTWWIDAARRAEGRISIAAKADADTLIDARRGAVQAGTDSLTSEVGGPPGELRTDKVDLARLDDGRFRVFVLMSCKE
jgi:hypothetical protein